MTRRKSTALVPVVAPAQLANRDAQRKLDAAIGALWAELESPESQRGYQADWKRYCAWLTLEGILPAEADVADVQRYVNDLRARGMAKATRARALSVLREVYRALVIAKVCAVNPAREVKNPKVDSTPKTPWLEEDQIRALLDVADADETWAGRRNSLLLRCLVMLGWRRKEIASMEVADIHGKSIDHTVKRGKESTVGIPMELLGEIKTWLEYTGIVDGPIFRRGPNDAKAISTKILYDVVVETAAKAGFETAPHALRRSFITLLHRRGVSLEELRLAVSHQSRTTTERYIKAEQAASQAPGEKLWDLVAPRKSK